MRMDSRQYINAKTSLTYLRHDTLFHFLYKEGVWITEASRDGETKRDRCRTDIALALVVVVRVLVFEFRTKADGIDQRSHPVEQEPDCGGANSERIVTKTAIYPNATGTDRDETEDYLCDYGVVGFVITEILIQIKIAVRDMTMARTLNTTTKMSTVRVARL